MLAYIARGLDLDSNLELAALLCQPEEIGIAES